MKIVFHSNQLSERGTETAIIDYAKANEDYLNNTSIFAFPEDKILCKQRFDELAVKYQIILYKSVEDLKEKLILNKIDLLYIISDGLSEDIADQISEIPTFIHCVFTPTRKHGTYYACIHQYLNSFYKTETPVLPHIINPFPECKDNLRKELNIPENALVYGSYAGKTTFNIKIAQNAIIQTAKKHPEIYFIFMNINNFCEEKNLNFNNIIFLPGSTDLIQKAKFINTTNAMIHARADGETFGLTVGEFASLNKPVITFKPNIVTKIKSFLKLIIKGKPYYATAHLMNLGDLAITYKSKRQLKKIFTSFDSWYNGNQNYDCFTNIFSPQKVMEIFSSIISSGK